MCMQWMACVCVCPLCVPGLNIGSVGLDGSEKNFTLTFTVTMRPRLRVAASPNPHVSSVNVEFDDGDTGRIPLDHVRLLPPDFPLVSEYTRAPS